MTLFADFLQIMSQMRDLGFASENRKWGIQRKETNKIFTN